MAMANTGAPNSTDAQFFITNGVPSTSVQQAFDFKYTIFGQLVAGQQTVNDLAKVAVTTGSSGEKSQPITPVVINTVALSSANPNGVLHIDTTSARPGETATITVTATDPTDGSHLTMTFKVTVGAYNGPTNPPINFVPFAVPFTATTEEDQPKAITLAGYSGYPGTFDQMFSATLVSPPSHGTISQFNGLNGTLVYTPDPGFSGTDSFQFAVQAWGTGVKPPPLAVSLPATVTIEVTAPLSGFRDERPGGDEQAASGDDDPRSLQRSHRRHAGPRAGHLPPRTAGQEGIVHGQELEGHQAQIRRVRCRQRHRATHPQEAVLTHRKAAAPG